LVHWEGYSDTEDSWVKGVDIDPEMVKAYLEELEGERQNTTSSPKLRRGRTARTPCDITPSPSPIWPCIVE
jgi:hypothetical protein